MASVGSIVPVTVACAAEGAADPSPMVAATTASPMERMRVGMPRILAPRSTIVRRMLPM